MRMSARANEDRGVRSAGLKTMPRRGDGKTNFRVDAVLAVAACGCIAADADCFLTETPEELRRVCDFDLGFVQRIETSRTQLIQLLRRSINLH